MTLNVNVIRFKKQLIEQRGECCEMCSKNPCSNLHHIDRDRSNNNPENLMLLCKSCHIEQHKELRRLAIEKGKLWDLTSVSSPENI